MSVKPWGSGRPSFASIFRIESGHQSPTYSRITSSGVVGTPISVMSSAITSAVIGSESTRTPSQSKTTTSGGTDPGGGKSRLKVNEAGLGPSSRSCVSRSSASGMSGRWPAGTHHRHMNCSIRLNHSRRRRITARCSLAYT